MEPFKDNHQRITDHLFLGVFLILFSIFIGSILYARLYTGNFTMTISPYPASIRAIEIAESFDFIPGTNALSIDSYIYAGTTYATINIEEIMNSEGHYVDQEDKYMSYRFYVRNSGAETIDIGYYMKLNEVSNYMDEYIRIIVIEDDESRMYQKLDQKDELDNLPTYEELPSGINFLTTNILFRDEIENIKPGEIKSVRIIIWLENQDPDMDESYQSGNIEVQLVFTVVQNYGIGNTHALVAVSESENLWVNLYQICVVRFGIYYEVEDNE